MLCSFFEILALKCKTETFASPCTNLASRKKSDCPGIKFAVLWVKFFRSLRFPGVCKDNLNFLNDHILKLAHLPFFQMRKKAAFLRQKLTCDSFRSSLWDPGHWFFLCNSVREKQLDKCVRGIFLESLKSSLLKIQQIFSPNFFVLNFAIVGVTFSLSSFQCVMTFRALIFPLKSHYFRSSLWDQGHWFSLCNSVRDGKRNSINAFRGFFLESLKSSLLKIQLILSPSFFRPHFRNIRCNTFFEFFSVLDDISSLWFSRWKAIIFVVHSETKVIDFPYVTLWEMEKETR